MNHLQGLLQTDPVVAAAGIDLLADALAAQGAAVTRVEWQPPVPGTEEALAALAADPAKASADDAALAALTGTRPHLVGMVPAHQAIPELAEGLLLHAGPPLSWGDCSGPMRGALIGALLYEGRAADPEEAGRLAARVPLEPCHHHHAAGPMAGVISASMPLAVVEDAATGRRAYSTLNEGLGKVLRYGAFAPEVIDRLHWMQAVLGPVLAAALARTGPIDLGALIAQALQMGDDGHNRNRAGTSLLLRALGPALVEGEGPAADRGAVFRFIQGNDHFMLNLVMAAGKLASDAASGIAGSSLVTVMARNGTEFGIRLSGTGDRWFTAPAPEVEGLYLPGFSAADANADLGDSAITETVGLGGMAMAASPAIVGFVGGTAAGAVRRTLEMYAITRGEHPLYRLPILEGRGTPAGIDATLVARTGIAPQINTGIAGREAGVGMVGAGLVEAPMECFVQAVRGLAARWAGPPAG
ncbi:MAG: DUF1116 domain-containing protein [Acidimicrobiia bacterium]|nr:DUF1116 domain-containing protein [Acidimicrobiia bacterium]